MKLAMAALALLILIPAAHADGFYTVTVIVGFQASNPVPQTFDVSYTVDATTGAVSNYSISQTGPLGAFTGPGLLPFSNWVDSEGDLLQLDLANVPPNELGPEPFLSPGTTYPAGILFDIVCNGFLSTCGQLFFGTLQPATSGTLTASPITNSMPEPETWMMLLAGLALVGLLTLHVPSTQCVRHASGN